MTESPLDDARAIVAGCILRDACGSPPSSRVVQPIYERVVRIELWALPAEAPPAAVRPRNMRRIIAVALCLIFVIALVAWYITA